MDNKISLAIVLIIGVSGLFWTYLGRGEIGIERAHGARAHSLRAMCSMGLSGTMTGMENTSGAWNRTKENYCR